ncbi:MULTISPECIES: hypothetical protein [Bradyrhizobium]|uniref:Uncharacterized protein n=2 Tax=Bradyrhizobium TaxID=374 RepID=A0A809X2Y3_9BRAD|nr:MULTISPECIES: hypothetical protein [Bradyrhizobium]BCE22142.1 hypothetical protein XF1B_48230 [Bradyrhizobium diazoefficiens]MBP1297065.1 hypothetical protein [Bradyrhizobium elkanii]MCS3449905.1 hypothetical protein [Bradyrhizobium elkanii]MCS3558951.1 hypothetical protein [Bradyrhizobium elkanii]MCW2151202.1 hypothetical protein [Bradyrhizobium elkanii]
MQTRFFEATVRATTAGHGKSTVDLNFRTAPTITRDDLHVLISDLLLLAHNMARDEVRQCQ